MTTLVKLDLKKPHQTYRLKSGEKVPGVTTILRELSKPELVQWAAWEERQGIVSRLPGVWGSGSIEGFIKSLPTNDKGEPAYFCNIKRDKAADLGTLTHERIRAWHHGTDVDPEGLDPELFKQSEHGLARFVSWAVAEQLTTVAVEHEMVSETQRVGGTGDWFCRRAQGLVYVDLKTSKANKRWPYRDTIAQSAQYAKMYEELTGEHVEEVIINRTGKEKGDPGEVYVLSASDREHGEALFEAARLAYEASYKMGR